MFLNDTLLHFYVKSSGVVFFPKFIPALYNVAKTSMQRHDVASTLWRRCITILVLKYV